MKFNSTLVLIILVSVLTACGKKGSETTNNDPEVINPRTGATCEMDFYRGQELAEVAINAYKAKKVCELSEEAVIEHISKLTN